MFSIKTYTNILRKHYKCSDIENHVIIYKIEIINWFFSKWKIFGNVQLLKLLKYYSCIQNAPF